MEIEALVIGGGVTGLVVGHLLQKQGVKFILSEPGSIGGLISTVHQDGFTLEQGPNVLVEKPDLISLLGDLGLANDITYPNSSSYRQFVWFRNKPTVVPKGPDKLLRSDLFTLREKLSILFKLSRRGLLLAKPDDVSISEFLSPLLPKHSLKELVDPALKGIFGGDIEQLSARSIFPSLWDHVQNGGSLISYVKSRPRGKIFVLKGGMISLTRALAQRLSGSITAERVVSVEPKSGNYQIGLDGAKSIQVRRVFICTAGQQTFSYLKPLGGVDFLNSMVSAPLVVVHASTEALSGQGSTGIPPNAFGTLFSGMRSRLLGIMYNSELFGHLAPTGQQLITVCLGGVDGQDILSLNDQELYDRVSTELWDKFKMKVSCLALKRWPHAIPQYTVGHFRYVAELNALEARYPGLKFVGADLGGVGVPDRVKMAYQVIQ